MFKYFVFILFFYFAVSNSVMDYGEFDLALTKHENCRGPKRKNCSDITITIIDQIYLKYNVIVKENVEKIKGKIIGILNDKQLLQLKIQNLCEHIFFGPLTMYSLNVTAGCDIIKGHYNFSVDIQSASRKFFGDIFMFGNWSIKVRLYNDRCNFICGVLNMALTPKKGRNKKK